VAGQRYRVKDGDKLPALALKFGVSVRAIKQANDLGEPPVLVPGSFIIIPNPPSSPPA
jgi:LysM repeat protein